MNTSLLALRMNVSSDTVTLNAIGKSIHSSYKCQGQGCGRKYIIILIFYPAQITKFKNRI